MSARSWPGGVVLAGLVWLIGGIAFASTFTEPCRGEDQSPPSPALPSPVADSPSRANEPQGTTDASGNRKSLGTLILVVGAAGTEEYGRQFSQWAERWRAIATSAGWKVVDVPPKSGDAAVKHAAPTSAPTTPTTTPHTTPGTTASGEPSQANVLMLAIAEQAGETRLPLWIVFLGHGTDDGRTARWNLAGPDVSADDLATWLAPIQRPLAVVNCSSSSGRFLQPLRAAGRVVIVATSGAGELNFSRFGDELSAVVGDPAADTDKDGQTSLLEAFRLASRRTEEYYTSRGQLPTEHAMLDDNGDTQGTRAGSIPDTGPVPLGDGTVARSWHLLPNLDERRLSPEQRGERDRLESLIDQLRLRKPNLEVDHYYAELEALLVQLAQLSTSLDE